jgi:hypothetical protein
MWHADSFVRAMFLDIGECSENHTQYLSFRDVGALRRHVQLEQAARTASFNIHVSQ